MSESATYVAIVRRTRAAFGRPIGPHLFRHALATSLANHHGSEIGLAAAILGHAGPATTEHYYNHAAMVDAVRHFQKAAIKHAALAEVEENQ
jgi:integrase